MIPGKNQGLGKGLAALIGDIEEETIAIEKSGRVPPTVERRKGEWQVEFLSVDLLEAGPYQPRAYFDEEALRELADSIKERGVLQPVVVRPMGGNGKHPIIAGERRWRACRLAGLSVIPAIVRDLTEKEALQVALIENIQRKDLTIVEEAEGYSRLIEEFYYTQEQLADQLGKSRSHISNLLRLLQLPDEVKNMLNDGVLSMGHARALLNAHNPSEVARSIVARGLNVRQTEALMRGEALDKEHERQDRNRQPFGGKVQKPKDEDLVQLEQMLSERMGLPVTIYEQEKGGQVQIQFSNLEELDKILQRLTATV
ncbi:MAG: chromosome partitioning protein ParB [Rickettsiales bacterium]|jgi:ParB family chromosome partitioning protein|nr:chromosome partitioning protein ParB [Rickettsiales bacterium]